MNNSNRKTAVIFPGFMEHHETENVYIVRSFFYSRTLLFCILFVNKKYLHIMYTHGKSVLPLFS